MWLLIVVSAYFLNAVAAVVDKFLIAKKIPNPAVYTFFIAALGLLGLVLIPWGFYWPGVLQFLVALLAGLTFTFALLYLFKALSLNEASRITPFIGGLSPIFVLIFSFLFLTERLGPNQLLAFFLIVAGSIVITWEKTQRKGLIKGFAFAVFSALLFGISYTLTKYVYNHQAFISGFVWMRMAAFLGALLLLFCAANRQAIRERLRGSDVKVGGLFLFGQASGALSFILVNYAISLANVSLVNALQGLQYVFLLLMVLILAKWRPRILEEKLKGRILIQKVAAILLIVAGLALLV